LQGQVGKQGLRKVSLLSICEKQISNERNPEMACKIPAACLLVARDPTPSPMALNKKNAKAVRHCNTYNILVLAEAKHKPKDITTQAE
jgi:hypothetical protein